MLRIALVIPQPLEKSVSRSRLTRGRKIPPVFLQHQAQRIEENRVPLSHLEQHVDASQNTTRACLRGFTIGGDGNIGVHHHGCHEATFLFRPSAARLIAAISPNSSPKKSLGQFWIIPKGSRSKDVSFDSRSWVKQK